MESPVLSNLVLSDYELKDSDISFIDERTVIVTKWDWEYSLAHKFQKAALTLVQETPHLRVLICCSHPEVLTNGRGLQKPRKGESFDLVEFDPTKFPELPYPLFQIERGGGLTFHHPGQFIFYPILKLNPKSLSLSLMTDQIFDFSIDVLSDWGVRNAHHENKLLGLWHHDKKLASMGIAIEKLTTYHGMALNIKSNNRMLSALNSLSPCGLSSDIYTSVENLVNLPSKPLETFQEQFLQRIKHEWK